tara:strand:- start:184 stop:909 length:726 start_codon:yes stop_codon:yes gene_type:complete
MANYPFGNPYDVAKNVEYWKDGDVTRFDPKSLAFKKKVYGRYHLTTIMEDKDSQKSGIQLILSPNDVTISKSDALLEKKHMLAFEGYRAGAGRSGTWGTRHSEQQKAQAYSLLEDITNRTNTINSILENPVNIARWANEERLIQEEEEERLLQIELEKQRKQDELKRQETARLLELENQRIQNEIKRVETARLLKIENQKIIIPIVTPEIIPEILPVVVATSSLLPLGIIALLLYSRTGRK